MTQGCISVVYSLTLRNQFNQSQTQQIIVYTISPFIYLTGIINIIFFTKGKNRASPPADILLFVSVFGLLRVTSYLIAAIYDSTNPPLIGAEPPTTFDSLCDGTGFINVMCQLADFFYTVVFCIYYVIKIRNPLKSWIKDNKEIHLFCLILIIGGTLIFFLTDLVGISILGVCGYKIGAQILVLDIVFTVSYFIVLIGSSVFFIKYLKSISKLDSSSKLYFKFYFKYLIISSLVSLIGVISLFVVTIKCLNDQLNSSYESLTIICNLSRMLTPLMVFIVILNHPQLSLAAFLRWFKQTCGKKSINEEVPAFYDDMMSTKRMSVMIELNSLNKNNLQELDYLAKIKDRNKACLINTILGCISLEQLQYLEIGSNLKGISKDFRSTSIRFEDVRNSSFSQIDEEIYGWNYFEKSQFELNQEIVMAFPDVFSKKLSTINLNFISFNSSLFKKLQQMQTFFDLYDKILPVKNQENIIENVSTDGGRSGMFFFFNFDKTVIIKTITPTQLMVLRQRMEAYFKYLIRNEQSLIVKILGLYTAVNVENQEKISFMLMGNILKSIPSKYILKSYDMKGSSYQRQVLSKEEIRNSQTIETRKTLKDTDFQAIEGKVNISQEDSKRLKEAIEQDVSFLCLQGLIDYSLILLKIDYQHFIQEQKREVVGLKTYKSTKQKGVVYVFGIIDYLETWNIVKKGEKWYKSIFNKGESISSQDPKFYAQRFMKNLITNIFP